MGARHRASACPRARTSCPARQERDTNEQPQRFSIGTDHTRRPSGFCTPGPRRPARRPPLPTRPAVRIPIVSASHHVNSFPTLDIVVVSWQGHAERSRHIARQIAGLPGVRLRVIYSNAEGERENGPGTWQQVPDDHFFGRKFAAALRDFDGDVLLLVQADALCTDWPAIVARCRRGGRQLHPPRHDGPGRDRQDDAGGSGQVGEQGSVDHLRQVGKAFVRLRA